MSHCFGAYNVSHSAYHDYTTSHASLPSLIAMPHWFQSYTWHILMYDMPHSHYQSFKSIGIEIYV